MRCRVGRSFTELFPSCINFWERGTRFCHRTKNVSKGAFGRRREIVIRKWPIGVPSSFVVLLLVSLLLGVLGERDCVAYPSSPISK